MATLSFKLRSTTSDDFTIQLFFNYGTNKRLRYSTGLRVMKTKNWDEKNERIKNVAEEVNKHKINGKLNEITTILNERYLGLDLVSNKIIDNELLKEICNEVFYPKRLSKSTPQHLEFLPFFEWYMQTYSNKPLPSTGRPLSKNTLPSYRSVFNKLINFQKNYGKLTYEKITLDFYDDFLTWLYEHNYSANYVGTIIKTIKTIMGAAYERDYHTNMDYIKKAFKKPTENVYNIYLTEGELAKLYNYDLSNEPTHKNEYGLIMTSSLLANARDLFLIGANTGLRVSDFNRLDKRNVITRNHKQFLEVTTNKRNREIAIPIKLMVKEILEKNGGVPPKKMPNQHINYAIKKLGELSEIDGLETKTITKGGKKVIINYKKFELITNHTARRSFCTNAYLSGMPTADIMAISGHTNEKTFYNYIKVSHLQRAEKIGEHNFFSEENLKVVNE